MVSLLDVNVLVALVTPSHQHFLAAWDWFNRVGTVEGWATCSLTELGAMRICAEIPPRLPPPQTAAALRDLQRDHSARYLWWPEAWPPESIHELREARTPKAVSDRYLLGLARRHRSRLATFDRGLAVAGGATVLCLTPERRRVEVPEKSLERDNGSESVM